MSTVNSNAVTGLIGLAKKAGAVAVGTEGVRTLARSGRAKLVIMASDCSPGAEKRIRNCCGSYRAELVLSRLTMAQLGSAVGKSPCAAIAVSDRGLSDAIKNKGAAIWQ